MMYDLEILANINAVRPHTDEDMAHIHKTLLNLTILNSKNGISKYCSDALICIAYYHDLFKAIDPIKHHILAMTHILTCDNDTYLDSLSKDERYVLATAVLEHRADVNVSNCTVLSRMLAASVRKAPSVRELIHSYYVKKLDKYEVVDTDLIYKKIIAKYGKYKYRELDEYYINLYHKEYGVFTNTILDLTKEHFESYVGELFITEENGSVSLNLELVDSIRASAYYI